MAITERNSASTQWVNGRKDRDQLKYPGRDNQIVCIQNQKNGHVVEFTHVNTPYLLEENDEYFFGISHEGFFIAHSVKSWFWEYQELQILFKSKLFTIEGTLPGPVRMIDFETNTDFITSLNSGEFLNSGQFNNECFAVITEHNTLYNLFPHMIDQLILLAKASIETGNPILWY